MNLRNETELANTQAKLALLESRYEELSNEPTEDEELRAATLKSLKKYINQFKEEIIRYQAAHAMQR